MSRAEKIEYISKQIQSRTLCKADVSKDIAQIVFDEANAHIIDENKHFEKINEDLRWALNSIKKCITTFSEATEDIIEEITHE